MAKNASYFNGILSDIGINLTEPLQKPDPYQITELTVIVNEKPFSYIGTLADCKRQFVGFLAGEIMEPEKMYKVGILLRQLTQTRKRAFNNGISFEIKGLDFLQANKKEESPKPAKKEPAKKEPVKKAPAKRNQEPTKPETNKNPKQ